MNRLAQGLVTIHPSAMGALRLDDGRHVEQFHHSANGAVFRVDGGPLIEAGISDRYCPRLHRRYGLVRCQGYAIVSVDPEGGAGETLVQLSGTVTIGAGEGSLLGDLAPIVVDGRPGVANLETRDWWTVDDAGTIDTGHVLVGGVDHGVARTSTGTWLIRQGAPSVKLWAKGGHATVAQVGGEVWYVLTTSDIAPSDLSRLGLGSGSTCWAAAFDARTGELRWKRDTGWVASHFAAYGSLLAISYEQLGRESAIMVVDLATDEVVVRRFQTGTVIPSWSGADYWKQAKPQFREEADGSLGLQFTGGPGGDEVWAVLVPVDVAESEPTPPTQPEPPGQEPTDPDESGGIPVDAVSREEFEALVAVVGKLSKDADFLETHRADLLARVAELEADTSRIVDLETWQAKIRDA